MKKKAFCVHFVYINHLKNIQTSQFSLMLRNEKYGNEKHGIQEWENEASVNMV